MLDAAAHLQRSPANTHKEVHYLANPQRASQSLGKAKRPKHSECQEKGGWGGGQQHRGSDLHLRLDKITAKLFVEERRLAGIKKLTLIRGKVNAARHHRVDVVWCHMSVEMFYPAHCKRFTADLHTI